MLKSHPVIKYDKLLSDRPKKDSWDTDHSAVVESSEALLSRGIVVALGLPCDEGPVDIGELNKTRTE